MHILLIDLSFLISSVLDFPPLGESSELDWGSRVEQEEIKEEVEHALNARFLILLHVFFVVI